MLPDLRNSLYQVTQPVLTQRSLPHQSIKTVSFYSPLCSQDRKAMIVLLENLALVCFTADVGRTIVQERKARPGDLPTAPLPAHHSRCTHSRWRLGRCGLGVAAAKLFSCINERSESQERIRPLGYRPLGVFDFSSPRSHARSPRHRGTL